MSTRTAGTNGRAPRPGLRLAYGLSQAGRVAWYLGQYAATRRLIGPLGGEGMKPFRTESETPDRRALLRAVADLFARDWRNVEAGIYAPPHDMQPNLLRGLKKARAYLADVPKVDARRRTRSNAEVLSEEMRGRFPRYYLQNFHYQTGGWLDDASAEIYDTQVEVLFTGTADAMRRQALVPIAEALEGRDQRDVKLLDVACGTGRFLTFLLDNYPRLNVTALDLSPNYLGKARRALRRWRATKFLEANAEAMPVEAGSQDIATCIYLFHELPPKVRPVIAGEIARILKPGGRLVFVDSIQKGDRADFDGLLDFFPWAFHEPYFGSYVEEDLEALFARAGLRLIESDEAFLSKVMTFEKD